MEARRIKTEPKDFNSNHRLCRLCMSEELLEDITKEDELSKWLSDYLSIVVSSNDHLSQVICSMCRIRLTEFHQFRTRCQEVQCILQSMTGGKGVSQLTNNSGTDSESLLHLMDKEEEQNDLSIQCDLCDKAFTTKKQLFNHNRTHASKKYACDRCGKSFVRRDHLNKHIKSHKDNSEDYETPCIVIKNESAESLCDMIVIEETKIESRTNSEDEARIAIPETESSTINKNIPKPFKCEICRKSYRFRSRLEYHKKFTHGKKKHECPICEKPFSYPHHMKDHMRTHEPLSMRQPKKTDNCDARPFKCNVCQKAFQTDRSLAHHKRYRHGPKNHKCHICGFRFAMACRLARHVHTHNRDRNSQ